MISTAHMKLFWMPWQTKRENYYLCMVVVEPTKHLFEQSFCPIYKGEGKSCLQLPHQELHLCCFWAVEPPIQDSRFRLICMMSWFATSHNRWKWLSWCVKLIWSFGMRRRCMVLGGDFWQILLVVPNGRQEDIVSASLPRSHLWQHVTILCFHINMRVMAANFEEQWKFAKWVLNVGDGSLFAIAEEEGVDLDWIKFPSHMRLPLKDCSLRGLIWTIYQDHQRHSRDAMYFMQCSILAPKSIDVDDVNNAILESLSEELHTYLSANSLTPIEEGASIIARVSMDSLYLVEFMNTLQFNGIANHKLELKVSVLILLLRNLNQSIGLCNGTRLIVKRLG